MLLSVQKRETKRKKDPKRLRRTGLIPAVLYGQGKETQAVLLNGGEFQAHLRKIPQGRLSTTIFNLKLEDGTETRAIIKDIQYHVVSYDILHIDFEALISGKSVNLNIPLVLTGVVDCVGVKLGGNLRQSIRYIRVSSPPDQIPDAFYVDVRQLGLEESIRVSDITIPEVLKLLTPKGELVALVAKK